MKGPQSLEDIHKRHLDRLAEQSKPKFISKKQREEEAIEKRRLEVEARNKKVTQAKSQYQNYILKHLKSDSIEQKKIKYDEQDDPNPKTNDKELMKEKLIKVLIDS